MNILGIGPLELTLIVIIALIVIGTKRFSQNRTHIRSLDAKDRIIA